MKNGYGWGFAMWRWGTLFSDQHICSLPKTWTKPRRISGRILVKLGRTYGDFQCWRKLRSCACASRWERNQSWAHTNSMSYAWTTKYASKNHALPTGDLIWKIGWLLPISGDFLTRQYWFRELQRVIWMIFWMRLQAQFNWRLQSSTIPGIPKCMQNVSSSVLNNNFLQSQLLVSSCVVMYFMIWIGFKGYLWSPLYS